MNITSTIKLLMPAKALKNITLCFISLHLHLKEFMLNYTLPLKQLYNHIKQSQYLLLSSMLIIRTINTASIRLTIYMEAADEDKDKITIHTKAMEGIYIKEINNME